MTLEHDDDTPVYVISVAAQLTGLHAQTLRQYDRLGLVSPGRTPGGGRRYSPRDIAALREIQELSSSGIGLEGVRRILELENQVLALTTAPRRAAERGRRAPRRCPPYGARRLATADTALVDLTTPHHRKLPSPWTQAS